MPGLLGGASGCAACAGPLGATGAVTGVVGTISFLSIFAFGFSPLIALALFGTSACIGFPAFFCLGPASAMTAAIGEGMATREYRRRDPRPAFWVALPIAAVAVLGSCVGMCGNVLAIGAFLGLSPGQGRAAAAVMGVGFLSGLVAGPAAAGAAIAADAIFGGPLEALETESVEPYDNDEQPFVPVEARSALTQNVAMLF